MHQVAKKSKFVKL